MSGPRASVTCFCTVSPRAVRYASANAFAASAATLGSLDVNPIVMTVVSRITFAETLFTSWSGDCVKDSVSFTDVAIGIDRTISASVAMSGWRVLAVLPGTGVTAGLINGDTTTFACAKYCFGLRRTKAAQRAATTIAVTTTMSFLARIMFQ